MTLEEKLGYFFFDKRQLTRSLTRQGYALEQPSPVPAQDAYVALGQEIVRMVLTEALIRSGVEEAELLRQRLAELLQEEALAQVSEAVGVGFVVKLSAEEKQQRAYEDARVLTETLFAVLAAVYFDGGFRSVREVILRLFQVASE